MSLADLWRLLEAEGAFGASRRLDAAILPDFYASIDGEGRLGLVLVTPFEPPEPPHLDTVGISLQLRFDDRWSIGIWLHDAALSPIFAELCESLVRACAAVSPPHIPALLMRKLVHWQRLLDSGAGGELSINELRGLVAELLILRECLSHWPASIVADGWTGPLGTPQDFVLPGALLEVKACLLNLNTVTISSIEQLDIPEKNNLYLAVVPLATVARGYPSSFSADDLISEIEEMMSEAPAAQQQLRNRVTAVGYSAGSTVERFFHNNGPRFFHIVNAFPKIQRSHLPSGIVSAKYQIAIDACAEFEVPLESVYGS